MNALSPPDVAVGTPGRAAGALVSLVTAVATLLFVTGCASVVPSPYGAGAPAPAAEYGRASRVAERPGLGTEWGQTTNSPTYQTTFQRKSGTRPTATDKLFYNDRAGARAMAVRAGSNYRERAPYYLADSLLKVALVDRNDRVLPSYSTRSNPIFIGESGDSYGIQATNTSNHRLEVIFSVDGLDSIDGKPAGYSKRGYIIGPGNTTTIRGFRTSGSTVARFTFGKVSDSYAEKKHGDSRNVGVIGFAVFAERGTKPKPHTAGDTGVRQKADPFPGGRYATPPPGY